MKDAFQIYKELSSTIQHKKSIDLWIELGTYHMYKGHDINKSKLKSYFNITSKDLDNIIAGDTNFPIELYDQIINYVKRSY